MGSTPLAVSHGLSGSHRLVFSWSSLSLAPRAPTVPNGWAPAGCARPVGPRVPDGLFGFRRPPTGLTLDIGRLPDPGWPNPIVGAVPMIPPGGIAFMGWPGTAE
jgi:hypothetical protein